MNKKTLTVSMLPNITFYSGEYAEAAASVVENRQYGTELSYFGTLSYTSDNNSYWSNKPSNIFGENPTKYNNIGDIINSTISYMSKFKNNNVEITVDKNVLTFNYRYEEDLNSNFDNTYITPSTKLVELLLSVNDMRFNKRNYYKNNIELKEISYAHKKYPYRSVGTIFTINEEDGEHVYDFGNQFVDYEYLETSYDIAYEGHIMQQITLADGTITYIPTGQTYTGFVTYYTYSISNINNFNDRMYSFFENNSNNVANEYNDLKTYFISELDTVLTLNLNTYSLGGKNLYAYFNFDSKYNNWFNNIITFDIDTQSLQQNDILAKIEPDNENYFNVNINTNKVCGNDVKSENTIEFNIQNINDLNSLQKFDIVNPSNIKGIDLSDISDKLISVNLINQYDKKINYYENTKTNWMIESPSKLKYLRLGNENHTSSLEEIYGISNIKTLEEINILNCNNLNKDFLIYKLNNLKVFNAAGSNIKNFIPKPNSVFTYISLPETINTISIKNTDIDEFNYTPNKNLLNVTLENIGGFGLNVQQFIKQWVDVLDSTIVEGKEITMLKDGIITNTNLTDINFVNYKVSDLLKFKYLGLNNFSGNISIVGDSTNNITRKEYLQLRDVFGDEIMECGNYTFNSKPIKFQYTLDPNALKQKAYFYYYTTIEVDNQEIKYLLPITNDNDDEPKEHTFEIFDNKGGHSLLDYFETIDRMTLKMNKEKFGYEITLPKKIFTDNDDASSLTKNLLAGDVLLYKGDRLILVFSTPRNNVYNYVKVGRFNFSESNSNEIVISFNKLTIVDGNIV